MTSHVAGQSVVCTASGYGIWKESGGIARASGVDIVHVLARLYVEIHNHDMTLQDDIRFIWRKEKQKACTEGDGGCGKRGRQGSV